MGGESLPWQPDTVPDGPRPPTAGVTAHIWSTQWQVMQVGARQSLATPLGTPQARDRPREAQDHGWFGAILMTFQPYVEPSESKVEDVRLCLVGRMPEAPHPSGPGVRHRRSLLRQPTGPTMLGARTGAGVRRRSSAPESAASTCTGWSGGQDPPPGSEILRTAEADGMRAALATGCRVMAHRTDRSRAYCALTSPEIRRA